MSLRERELASYKKSWIGKPPEQVFGEIASWAMETKGIPDPYLFLISENGKLLSPVTGIPIEKSIEKNSFIGQKEFEAFIKIQDWSNSDTENQVAIWISPPHKDRSYKNRPPESKIIISQIEVDSSIKILFNRSINLNISKQDCLNIAHNLDPLNNIEHHEDLRSQPIFLELPKEVGWIEYLENVIDAPEIWEMITSEKDLEEKEKAIENAKTIYQELFINNQTAGYDSWQVKKAVEKANSISAFGTQSVSCPPGLSAGPLSLFETFYQNSLKIENGKYVKRCGNENCKAEIEKVITAGYKCSKCGRTYEGC